LEGTWNAVKSHPLAMGAGALEFIGVPVGAAFGAYRWGSPLVQNISPSDFLSQGAPLDLSPQE
jgi:hypothetical protein